MNTPLSPQDKDNAHTPRRFFMFWGIPLCGLAAASLLPLMPAVETGLFITSFAWIGIACLVNAMQCSRVHCWFTGPWCLLTALLLLADVLAIPGTRQLSFSLIVNVGGAGTVVLWLVPELALGRYFVKSGAVRNDQR